MNSAAHVVLKVADTSHGGENGFNLLALDGLQICQLLHYRNPVDERERAGLRDAAQKHTQSSKVRGDLHSMRTPFAKSSTNARRGLARRNGARTAKCVTDGDTAAKRRGSHVVGKMILMQQHILREV